MPIKINGSTSGSVTLAAPATGSDVTVTLPTDLNAKAPLNMSVNPQTGTSYTLTTSDSANIITMTNAAASTVTIPTNASAAIPIGTSTEIVNLSTGVNTTVSAAGGVTFNGGPVVLSPGSSVTLVKIGTDAWMAQGQGSPGLVHIASSTFSAASSVSVNNCFSSSYDNYFISLRISAVTADASITFRWRASGSDATGAAYYGHGIQVNASGTVSSFSGNATTSFGVLEVDNTSSGAYYLASITAGTPNLSSASTFGLSAVGIKQDATTGLGFTSNGYHITVAQYDGFSILASAGNITGAVRVYGYRN